MDGLASAGGWDGHLSPDIRHIEKVLMDEFQGIDSLLELNVFRRELGLQGQRNVSESWRCVCP